MHLTAEASKLGIAGVLALCPYYNRPSQAGIEVHLRAVAEATDLPVIIYDIPVRTGRKVSTALLARLAHEVDNIVGVKDAAGNPAETARLVAAAPAGYEVYSGDDAMTLPLLAVGAVGLIGVATHWVAPDVVELFDRWEAGDAAGARQVNDRLLESWAFETGDEAPNPGPAKAMLRHLGQPAGHCRPPMGADPPWLAERAAEVHASLVAARGVAPTSGRESFLGGIRPGIRTDPARCDPAQIGECTWLSPSGSSSSAGWGRSGATAWPSSRARATPGGSCSSTAG